ncbi:MAG: MoaD/ThiS family protein [Sphingomonas sp.]|nr:MoaD/ThiS family protein [Sphingomonas sp.]
MIIFFFGRLADLLGRDLSLGLPPCSVADVRREIARLYPAAAGDLEASRSRACLNDELVDEDRVVGEGDEIAFLPPLSGG